MAPEEYKYLELSKIQVELMEPLGREVKHLHGAQKVQLR